MGKMTKPKARIPVARSSNNDKRALRSPAPSVFYRRTLAARAHYKGSGKHKFSPRAFGLDPAPREADDTMCDAHAGFTPADMRRIPRLFRRGIRAGLIGHLDKQGDPTILWTVDLNGWIYEARITTPTQALYHGYPLLPADAFAKKVIARYRDWAMGTGKKSLVAIYEAAQARYS